ncbi:radical SAM protein [Flavobacterium sp. U410]|jgi:uncharacterized protein
MKASTYNNFVYYNDKFVGYNALKNSFILLEQELYSLYEAAKNENKINEFKLIHPSFYNFMIQNGFFVENNCNELEEVKKLQREIDNKDDFFDLFINPTMNCNFKCWYCYETHIASSKMNKETIQSVIKFCENTISENKDLKRFYLSWFGGEPLLQYQDVVLPLLKELSQLFAQHNIKFNSGFTTNGLLINQEMINSFLKYDVDQLQITLDGIKPVHDKIRYISKNRGSYDEIISNIILLAQNNLQVIVRVNCTEETLKGLDEIMSSFSNLDTNIKKNISFTFHRVWQAEQKLEEDVSEYIKKYNGQNFNVSGVALDSFRDSCYADKRNQALINYNGEVFKCSARDFKSSNKEGVLKEDGRISWNDIFEKRMSAKLKNKPCQTCSILPLCGGGCSQVAMESEGKDYCVYDFDEDKKKQVVLDTFLTRITN